MNSNKVEAESKRSQAYILIKQGYSVRDTAQLIGKSSFFVQKWSKRGENGTFERKKGSGRPSKISSKILTTLEKSKYKRHQSTRKLSRELKHSGLAVCKSTVHNYLKKNLGLKASKRKRQPLITEKQRKNRLRFAKKYQDLSEKKWIDYVFSDELPMYLFYEQNRKNDIVWGSQEDKVPVAKTVKKSAYVNIGGGGGWGNVSKWTFSNPYYAPGTNGRRGVLC